MPAATPPAENPPPRAAGHKRGAEPFLNTVLESGQLHAVRHSGQLVRNGSGCAPGVPSPAGHRSEPQLEL